VVHLKIDGVVFSVLPFGGRGRERVGEGDPRVKALVPLPPPPFLSPAKAYVPFCLFIGPLPLLCGSKERVGGGRRLASLQTP